MDLVDEKMRNATKTTCDKIEKPYAAVVAVEYTTGKPIGVKNDVNLKNGNMNECIRKRGIPEDLNKMKGEHFVPTNNKVNDLLESIVANEHVTEMQGLGTCRYDRKKPRAVLVTLTVEKEASITLAKMQEFRKSLVETNI